ncbi:MAG: zinc ribbon-containing protein [Aigarchaeota archaeon]|nr:zinc ribbon-containing protein [Candidatus Pelearchaeum maunauluense]
MMVCLECGHEFTPNLFEYIPTRLAPCPRCKSYKTISKKNMRRG